MHSLKRADNDAAFLSFVDRLLRVAGAPGSVRQRAEGIAAAVCSRQAANTPASGASSAPTSTPEDAMVVASLFQGVAYAVLNIPVAAGEQRDRTFVAVINPAEARLGLAPSQPEERQREYCSVSLLSAGGVGSVLRARWTAAWQATWARYADVTAELQSSGIFTWNQFLLHGCENPMPIGIAWAQQETSRVPLGRSGIYIPFDAGLAEALGLPEPSGDWLRRLAAIRTRSPTQPELPEELQRRWQSMVPRQNVDVTGSVAAGIYFLLTHYAPWGGGALLSIPVPIAMLDTGPVTGVLTIASRSPLTSPEILRWRLLAAAVFPRLTIQELVVARARSEAAALAYGMQRHSMRNTLGRAIPADADAKALRRWMDIELLVLEGAARMAGASSQFILWTGESGRISVSRLLELALSSDEGTLTVSSDLGAVYVDPRFVALLVEVAKNAALGYPRTPVTVDVRRDHPTGTVSMAYETVVNLENAEQLARKLLDPSPDRGGVNWIAELGVQLTDAGLGGSVRWELSYLQAALSDVPVVRRQCGDRPVFLVAPISVYEPSRHSGGRLSLRFAVTRMRAIRP